MKQRLATNGMLRARPAFAKTALSFALAFCAAPAALATPPPAPPVARVAATYRQPVGYRQAQSPAAAAQIEVLVLEGSSGPGGIDPSLQNLPQLTRPPFSAYSHITVVSRTTLPLGQSASNVSLPNGNSAAITSPGRGANGRYQVNVNLTLGGNSHAIQFSATPGDPFFTARSTGPNSALILGFIVR